MAETDKKVKTEIKTGGEQNTGDESTEIFECSTCHASMRFLPLHVFNERGAKAQLILGKPALIMCGGCRTVYKWEAPATPNGHDGGWVRDSLLDDALAMSTVSGK